MSAVTANLAEGTCGMCMRAGDLDVPFAQQPDRLCPPEH